MSDTLESTNPTTVLNAQGQPAAPAPAQTNPPAAVTQPAPTPQPVAPAPAPQAQPAQQPAVVQEKVVERTIEREVPRQMSDGEILAAGITAYNNLPDDQKKAARHQFGVVVRPGWGSAAALGLPNDVRLIADGGASTVHGLENAAAKVGWVVFGGIKLARWLFF